MYAKSIRPILDTLRSVVEYQSVYDTDAVLLITNVDQRLLR